MNSDTKLKSKASEFPKLPGVYQFISASGEVLYVGKAKNLRVRVKQYFGHDDSRPQIPFLMAEATNVTYTVVDSELESAFLENTLIKQHHPRFNIDLKDDKNYAFIKIDFSTEIPQITYTRSVDPPISYKLAPKSLFFGPYTAAYKIRNTLNLVRKIFSFCANTKVGSRPCFYYHMHRCPGVCVGKISLTEYREHLEKIAKFLQGDTAGVYKKIKAEMQKSANHKRFETAARLRDQLKALELLNEKQNVILAKKVDWDIISLSTESGFSCVNLFKIRGGKLFDKENFIYELPTSEQETISTTEIYGGKIMQRFVEQYYQETSFAPKIIYTQIKLLNEKILEQIIKSRFHKTIKVILPQKGKSLSLIKLGGMNANEFLKTWLTDKAGNLDKINQSLEQLKQTLNLPSLPNRIECYDISNIQGTNPVGSMVVFSAKGGSASGGKNFGFQKSEYRKFKIQGKNTPDDFAMMKEMLSRRLARSIGDKTKVQISRPQSPEAPADGGQANNKTWPIPDLIVIDGGKGQLNAALSVLRAIRYPLSAIPVIGLAKRLEEIFLPNQEEPIILGHDQPALQLLQRLRDETHRFGITFHRQLRSKQAVKSALDDIPGVGPKTKKLLKTKFGTVAQIKKTPLADLSAIVGEKLAKIIQQGL